jgi:hypothetical protein
MRGRAARVKRLPRHSGRVSFEIDCRKSLGGENMNRTTLVAAFALSFATLGC